MAAASDPAVGEEGFYLGAGYAMVYSKDADLEVAQANDATSALVDFDLGFRSTTLSVGYRFRGGWRAELETGYRRNELEVIEFADARGLLNTGGSNAVDAFTGFANLYYEIATPFDIRPYLGIGAGLADVGYKTSFVQPGFEPLTTELFDDRDTAFAWQAIAGASLRLTPRTRLAAEYRYWRTAQLEFSADTPTGEETYETRHKLHMAGLQLQYFPGAPRRAMSATGSVLPLRRRSFYLATQFGALAAEDSDIDFATDDESVDTNFDAFDLGSVASIAFGSTFSSRRKGWPLRAELEAMRFANDGDLVDYGQLVGEYRLRGDTRVYALAANLLFDYALPSPRGRGITPYFGMGLGYAWANYDLEVRENSAGPGNVPGGRSRPGATPGNPPGMGPNAATQLIDDRTSGPLLQGLLGVTVQLGERIDVSLGYRYWWAPALDLRAPDGTSQETEHSAHAIQLGLRFVAPRIRR